MCQGQGQPPGPPGRRGCLRASTPKAFLQRMLGGGAVGGAAHGGAPPSAPCHSATTRQRSSHNAPGRDKREHPPVSRCQSRPGGSPKTSERKSLRSWWNYLEGAEGGRPEEAGRGCWRFSAARPVPGRATFKAHLRDGNSFQPDSRGKTKGMPSRGALQSSPSSSPVEPGAAAVRNGMHRCCQGCQCFGAPTGVLPGARRILAPRVDQTRGIWPLLEAPEMAPG